MNSLRGWLFPVMVVAGVAAVACSSAPPADSPDDSGDDSLPDPSSSPPVTAKQAPAPAPKTPMQSATCPYTGAPLDVSGFAVCGDGGRCVPAAVIPMDQRSRLATCPTGFCVPQKIIEAQGQLLPKACKSLADGEGRCESTVFPDLQAQKDSLPQDVCDANERCAPCFNPVDGTETGACRTVSCDAPKTKGTVFPSCCTDKGTSRGRCVPKATMPPEAASGLDKKECDSSALCVPQENLDPKYVPPACTANNLLGDYDGVCISTCVKSGFLQSISTSQGSCTPNQFCAPCKNPLTGSPTGAPGCPP